MENFINEFLGLLDEKPQFKVDGDTKFKEIPGWDSLVALSLIVMVSDNYGKSIDGEVVRSCTTIRDLFEIINA